MRAWRFLSSTADGRARGMVRYPLHCRPGRRPPNGWIASVTQPLRSHHPQANRRTGCAAVGRYKRQRIQQVTYRLYWNGWHTTASAILGERRRGTGDSHARRRGEHHHRSAHGGRVRPLPLARRLRVRVGDGARSGRPHPVRLGGGAGREGHAARRVGPIRSQGRAKKGRRSGGRGSAARKRSGMRARRPLACPMARGRGSVSPRRHCRPRR